MLGGVGQQRRHGASRRWRARLAAAGWTVTALLVASGAWALVSAFERADLDPAAERARAALKGCTALALDRIARQTTAEPCPGASDMLTAQIGERPPYR
jgi:hypothetical protein